MRTKTLLTAVAALAAGVITSQAQVYSANIVGYVSQTYSNGFVQLANPVDLGVANTLTNIFPNSGGALDGSVVDIWNGSSFTVYTLDSTFPTGVGDANDVNPVPAPVISPGQLFYFDNLTGTKITNILTGTVHVEGGQTGSNVGATTNTCPAGFNFVASKIPVGGGVSSVLQLTNPGGILDGSTLQIPNINASGQFLGYTIVTFDSSFGSGFGDANDVNPVPEPIIPVGTGFIFDNLSGSTYKWIQTY